MSGNTSVRPRGASWTRSGRPWACWPSCQTRTSSLSHKEVLDPGWWKMLIQQFWYDNYWLHQLGNNSVFTLTLQAGLSAINTSQCYKEDSSSRSPVYSPSLNKLAQPLPIAHCTNSNLVHKISGNMMNENNLPLMLPNGHNSLLSIHQDKKVVCLRTKEVFHFSQTEKVYIM